MKPSTSDSGHWAIHEQYNHCKVKCNPCLAVHAARAARNVRKTKLIKAKAILIDAYRELDCSVSH